MKKTRSGMRCEPCEIVLVPFPYSDASFFGMRPALIVSKKEFNDRNNDIVVCMITSNTQKNRDTILLDSSDFCDAKLPVKSAVKPYRLFTVEKRKIIKKYGELKVSKFQEVSRSLSKILA